MSDYVSFSVENIAIMKKTRELLDEYNGTAYDDGNRTELQNKVI